ncbi:MAG: hypothetical protein PGN13_15440 [Patulibacter minatonensis]
MSGPLADAVGHLTAAAILAGLHGTPPGELSVFMCGPAALLRTLQHDLRGAGVRARNIHREHFDWR